MGRPTAEKRLRSADLCPALDPKRTKTSHNPQGGTRECISLATFTALHAHGQHTNPTDRCNIHGLGLDQGLQEPWDQPTHQTGPPAGSSKTYTHHSHPHTWGDKQKSRLAVSQPRPEILLPGQASVHEGVPTFSFLPHDGPFCQSAQPTNQEILFVAGGPPQRRRGLQCRLGPPTLLAKPTLGHNPPMPAQIEKGPGHGVGLPPGLAVRSLVEGPAKHAVPCSTAQGANNYPHHAGQPFFAVLGQ